jgi:hypothetical protein
MKKASPAMKTMSASTTGARIPFSLTNSAATRSTRMYM